jgi:N6-L-threonylcarbamoyladenine synthase
MPQYEHVNSQPIFNLAIESSCDDFSCSILKKDNLKISIISNVVYSQDFIHGIYGGVVPELASRNHIKSAIPAVEAALLKADMKLKDINLLSVTSGPGLAGSLLVGLMTAKTISYALKIPIAAVNHIEGHIFSPFLKIDEFFPFIALVISGGHSHIYIVKSHEDIRLVGKTRDDACGEAFDKISNFLNYGYPGGKIVDTLAEKGNINAFNFSMPMEHSDSFDLSFSGLKTQVISEINKLGGPKELQENTVFDIFACLRETIAKILYKKVLAVCDYTGIKNVSISGGVSANSRIRSIFLGSSKLNAFFPEPAYSTDNAAMIGYTGFFKKNIDPTRNKKIFYSLNAQPAWEL